MALMLSGQSLHSIAEVLGRSPSTISRERRRNGWKTAQERGCMGCPAFAGGYNAMRAQTRAKRLRRMPRQTRKPERHSPRWQAVRCYWEQGWSPEQIACRLNNDCPERPDQHVSHKTISTSIYAYPKGELRREKPLAIRGEKYFKPLADQATKLTVTLVCCRAVLAR